MEKILDNVRDVYKVLEKLVDVYNSIRVSLVPHKIPAHFVDNIFKEGLDTLRWQALNMLQVISEATTLCDSCIAYKRKLEILYEDLNI